MITEYGVEQTAAMALSLVGRQDEEVGEMRRAAGEDGGREPDNPTLDLDDGRFAVVDQVAQVRVLDFGWQVGLSGRRRVGRAQDDIDGVNILDSCHSKRTVGIAHLVAARP
jgi:hypothetical protein